MNEQEPDLGVLTLAKAQFPLTKSFQETVSPLQELRHACTFYLRFESVLFLYFVVIETIEHHGEERRARSPVGLGSSPGLSSSQSLILGLMGPICPRSPGALWVLNLKILDPCGHLSPNRLDSLSLSSLSVKFGQSSPLTAKRCPRRRRPDTFRRCLRLPTGSPHFPLSALSGLFPPRSEGLPNRRAV